MTNDLIYVYCLCNSSPKFQGDLELKSLEILAIDDFYAVVKYVSASEFSEKEFLKRSSDIPWLEANAREHLRVISRIMKSAVVIPFKFVTIFQSQDSLKKFISDYHDVLIENFRRIEAKEEWTVKIYCDRNALSKQMDELSEEAAVLEKTIMASSAGKAFFLQKKKNELVENEMDRICKKYGQEYFDELKNLSEETCLNNLLPKEFTGREDTMILNASFLINKNKVVDFIKKERMLRKRDVDSGIFIESTGPWPPFGFISVKEKRNAQ